MQRQQGGWRVDKNVHEDRTYQKAKSKFPEGYPNDPKVLKIGIPKMNATKLLREPKWIQESEIGIQKDADGCRIRFKTYAKRLPEGCLNRSKSQLKKYP